jgi:hypothetical protein
MQTTTPLLCSLALNDCLSRQDAISFLREGTIEINGKKINGFAADVFHDLPYSVKDLILSSNKIKYLPADIFRGLANLTSIGLANNQLSGLPGSVFNGLSRLKTLDLSYNELNALPSDIFRQLNSLYTLLLEYNPLVSLPKNIFSGLTRLTDVSVPNSICPLKFAELGLNYQAITYCF